MRKPWAEYFLDMADLVATRATCPRAHHGAVIVRDNRVISTGYNGVPSGEEHCEDVGCRIIENHCIATIHAEENAIITAGRFGISVNLADMYVTATPCQRCWIRIKASGIKNVVVKRVYLNGIFEELEEPTRIPL